MAFFLVWLFFFDTNNLIDRISVSNEIKRLEATQNYFIERIYADSVRMRELTTDKESLEKFAREQYLMKKDNEEIFVIIFE